MKFKKIIYAFLYLLILHSTAFCSDALSTSITILACVIKTTGDCFCAPGKALYERRLPSGLSFDQKDLAMKKFEQAQCERCLTFGCTACLLTCAGCCCIRSGLPLAAEITYKGAYVYTTAAIITPQIPTRSLTSSCRGSAKKN